MVFILKNQYFFLELGFILATAIYSFILSFFLFLFILECYGNTMIAHSRITFTRYSRSEGRGTWLSDRVVKMQFNQLFSHFLWFRGLRGAPPAPPGASVLRCLFFILFIIVLEISFFYSIHSFLFQNWDLFLRIDIYSQEWIFIHNNWGLFLRIGIYSSYCSERFWEWCFVCIE